jgi:hypothetical protein
MNANDLIDSYVADVARLLPRKQRDDVAFELRALLVEELDAKAEAARRAPDAALALELLAGFGRPAEVAARYRPALVLIDPADTRTFVRASAIGMAILWIVGLVATFQKHADSIANFVDVLQPLGEWWIGVAIPSLWWPGFMVVCFAVGAWVRRRWPHQGAWKPRPAERERINRFGSGLAVVGIVIGLLVLVEPSGVLDVFFAGRAAPEAYAALSYDPDFLRLRAPVLLSLLIASAVLLVVVTIHGRWTSSTRRFDLAVQSALSLVMAWVALDGRVLQGEPADSMVRSLLVVFLALGLFELGRKLLRERRRVRAPAALVGKPTA